MVHNRGLQNHRKATCIIIWMEQRKNTVKVSHLTRLLSLKKMLEQLLGKAQRLKKCTNDMSSVGQHHQKHLHIEKLKVRTIIMMIHIQEHMKHDRLLLQLTQVARPKCIIMVVYTMIVVSYVHNSKAKHVHDQAVHKHKSLKRANISKIEESPVIQGVHPPQED